MKKFIIVFLLLAALPLSASARYYGGSHVSVGIGVGGYGYPAYPAYYPAYPAYPAYSYYPPAPAPVIVQDGPYGTYARPPVPQQQPPQEAFDNGYCREFSQNIVIDGRTQRAYGTSCRQPDGTWQVVTPAQ